MGAGVIAADRLLRTVRAGVPRQTKNRKIWTEGRSKRQAQPRRGHHTPTTHALQLHAHSVGLMTRLKPLYVQVCALCGRQRDRNCD